MPQQQPGPAGSYGAQPDDDQWQQISWPGAAAPPPWPGPVQPGRGGGRRRIQPVTAAVIAIIAALAAAVMVLVLVNRPSSAPPSSTAPGGAPAAGGAPVQGGGGAFGEGGGGGGGHLFMGGQVTKISSTSITLGGQGHSVTAAITSSTRFTGTVKSASGIKAGDRVMATISGYGTSHPVASSISDPAQMP